MTLDTANTPKPIAPSHVGRSNPGRVQGKVKAAIMSMAWEGMTFAQAARKASLSTYAMRLALERPNVQAFLRIQRQVFRASLTDRATFRMIELSEQDDNRAAAVTATARLMNDAEDQQVTATQRVVPGLVVVIQSPGVTQALPQQVTIEHDTNDINDLADPSS